MLCPICRAENAAPPACRRCRADLSLLWQLEEARARHLREVEFALTRRRFPEAEALLNRAEAIRSDGDSARLRAILSLLQGDFPGALRHYQVANQHA